MKLQPLLQSITLIFASVAQPLVGLAQDLPQPTNYWADNPDYIHLLNQPLTPLNGHSGSHLKYPEVEKKQGLPLFIGPSAGESVPFKSICHINPVDPPHRFDSDTVSKHIGALHLQPGFSVLDANTYYNSWPHTTRGLASYTFQVADSTLRRQFVVR